MSFPGSIVLVLLASLASLVAGAALLAACDGRVLSLGTNTPPSLTVAASEVSATVTPCGENAAHPNICCTMSAGQDPSCVTYPEAPFTQCTGEGATTYADPRWCCPLDGGSCGAPPTTLDAGASACALACPPGACGYTCPPGFYSSPDAPGIACCMSGMNTTACSGGGAPLQQSCPACPPGWEPPEGMVGLCCMTAPTGATECFSQVGSALDGGDAQDAGTGAYCFSSTQGYGCIEQAIGHYYTANCDLTVCSCIVDTNLTVSTFPAGLAPSSVTQLFAKCGFPIPAN
jgi:hypothetical protein